MRAEYLRNFVAGKFCFLFVSKLIVLPKFVFLGLHLVKSQRSGKQAGCPTMRAADGGYVARFSGIFVASGFSVSTRTPPSAPPQLTHTVGWLAPKSKNKTVFESQVAFNNIGEPQKHG
jgi:hypothetical protein